ncbi:MAG: PAS domain-containing protein [Deltaproteobacteria bacterium]|nr:PAS domain-containing protein [Deltaproteobacteria bacterium]
MQSACARDPGYLNALIDLIPAIVLVVDNDVRILDYNEAGGALVGLDSSESLQRRAGDVLHCLHSTDAPGGCGQGLACRTCIVRTSVNEAFAGSTTVRRRANLELVRDGAVTKVYVLLRATAFEHGGSRRVLLILEDIGELAEFQRITTICMSCRNVRIDGDRWGQVEAYFKRYWDMDFSHGLCPQCATAELDRLDAGVDTQHE